MKYSISVLALLFALGSAFAAPLEAPPQIQSVQGPAVKPQAAPPPPSAVKEEDLRLEPTEADLLKARKEREQNQNKKRDTFVSSNGTKIESISDKNNHLTSVRVTPGMTSVPYTMKNKADRPADVGPTANKNQTLDTPKFIEFKW